MLDLFFRTVRAYRLTLSSEAALKREMQMILDNHGVRYLREFNLDEHNRPDFMVDDYAIEVKIKGNAKAIYKQCERYCQFERVRGLVLVSNRAMGFPEMINGKPCHVLQLGKAWL